jgi:hypothetical protein
MCVKCTWNLERSLLLFWSTPKSLLSSSKSNFKNDFHLNKHDIYQQWRISRRPTNALSLYKLRASCMLGKLCATWAIVPTLLLSVVFQIGSHANFALASLRQRSSYLCSWWAGIIDVYHHSQLNPFSWLQTLKPILSAPQPTIINTYPVSMLIFEQFQSELILVSISHVRC